MLMVLNSERIASSVVKVPGPAIRGKTIGTSVADWLSSLGPSDLKISTPNIISIEMMSMTTAPATANEETSTWKSFSIHSPTSKKMTSSPNE